eukprot:TRINITY_DN584_c0_g1_i1.p1 TRINITY_DN584_c0_g1~~TRINITY_DN584_c0_g1_i1.p1  ORF type:complete len:163 (+),score=44.37 TRINITY_DN584_c0_g1_i1:345-833(+)
MSTPGWSSIVNLTLVPFGNAQISAGKLTCQHGEEECKGNSWEQCAIHHYPDPAQHFPFYLCMETAAEKMLTSVQKCATKASLDYSTLSKCFNDKTESAALQTQAAADTPSDHQYVPWVLINGKKSASDGDKVLAEVCAAYTGTAPAACSKYTKAAADKRCYV